MGESMTEADPLRQLLQSAMSKNPEERPESPLEFASQLEKILDDLGGPLPKNHWVERLGQLFNHRAPSPIPKKRAEALEKAMPLFTRMRTAALTEAKAPPPIIATSHDSATRKSVFLLPLLLGFGAVAAVVVAVGLLLSGPGQTEPPIAPPPAPSPAVVAPPPVMEVLPDPEFVPTPTPEPTAPEPVAAIEPIEPIEPVHTQPKPVARPKPVASRPKPRPRPRPTPEPVEPETPAPVIVAPDPTDAVAAIAPVPEAAPIYASNLEDLSVDVVGSTVVVTGRLSGASVRPLHYLHEETGAVRYVIKLPQTHSELGVQRLPVGSRIINEIGIQQGTEALVLSVRAVTDEVGRPRFTYSGNSFRLELGAP